MLLVITSELLLLNLSNMTNKLKIPVDLRTVPSTDRYKRIWATMNPEQRSLAHRLVEIAKNNTRKECFKNGTNNY